MALNKSKISFCLYAAFLQGIGLVTFPAASIVLKSEQFHRITDQQYGISFIPQVLFAVICTYFAAGWLRHYSRKQLIVTGIVFNVLQLICAISLRWTVEQNAVSFALLLGANAFLGGGFGLTVAILNLTMVDLVPEKESSALTSLHAMVGIGAALGPVMIGFLHHRVGDWTAGPMITVALWCVALLILCTSPFCSTESEMMRKSEEAAAGAQTSTQLPTRVLWFLGSLILYGAAEAHMGNWAIAYAHEDKGLSFPSASLCLSAFWLFLTIGRVLSTYVTARINPKKIYWLFPILMSIGFTSLLLLKGEMRMILTHALIGLGCSAFFPMTLGLGIHEYPKLKEKLSSLGLTALMIGVGLGSALIGFLRDQGWVTLHQGFEMALVISIVLLLRSLVVSRKESHLSIEK